MQSSNLVSLPLIPQVVTRIQQDSHPPQVDLERSGLPVVRMICCPLLLSKAVFHLGWDICHMKIKLFYVEY